MKVIWDENIFVGTTERKVYFIHSQWRPAGVESHITTYSLQVKAVYDKPTQILGISCFPRSLRDGSNYYDPETIDTATQVLEFAVTREAAIRSVLTHIERWKANFQAELPPTDTRSDEQVKADYFATEEHESES